MGSKEAQIPRVGRGVSPEQVERIRASVVRGVEEVVKPFLRRVAAQSRIPYSRRRYRSTI